MPWLELAHREVRAALTSTALWLTMLASGPLAALALRRATESSWDASDVVVAVMSAATTTTMLGLPFVIARVGADHATSRALVQLGHGAAAIVLARFLALVVALGLTLLPPLTALAAFAVLAHAQLDLGAVATVALGHVCMGIAVIGVGLIASALTSSRAAAVLATLVVTAGAWTLEAQHAPGSFAMPTAALGVFERGLIDLRDVVSLVAGGLGLALASAALLSRTVSTEQRALRCAGILVVTALLCGASSQLRVSVDVTRDQRASLAPPLVEALGRVGDRVEATLHMRRDDERVEVLERDVLLPLRRSVKLRVRFGSERAPHTSTSARPAADASLVTWRVGAREQTSDALAAERVVPIVLELAGVDVPRVLPPSARPRHEGGPSALVLALLFGVWPLLALGGVLRGRRP